MPKVVLSFLLVIISLLICTGCATSYHPLRLIGGGYTDLALSDDTFSVTFAGNGYSSNEEVMAYALLRMAELSIEKGFPFFRMLTIEDKTEQSWSFSPMETRTIYTGSGYGKTAIGDISVGGGASGRASPKVELKARGLKRKPSSPDQEFYDARVVRDDIRRKFKVDRAGA